MVIDRARHLVRASVLTLDGRIDNQSLFVASGATLMGSGTILGTTTIAGLHAPGNSPGIQTLGNLSYANGASVQWDLWKNTSSNSPLAYDQISLSGDLAFDGSTQFNLVFTGSDGPTSYSEVAWNDVFWDTNQEWLVYDVSGTTTGFGNLSLVTTNWQDGAQAFFNSARPQASFRLEQRTNDVYLVYSVIPEPGALALAGIGAVSAAWAARRRRARMLRRNDARRPTGMTLVELLVVIAIVGVLIGLLLPTLQAVRESGRRVYCVNNLRQMATACLQHEQANGFYPSGGWGCYWGGDPDRGFGPEQPGGWIYNILPYLQQLELWSRGAGQTTAQKEVAAKTMFETPLPLFNCPTRRPSQLYPCAGSFTVNNAAATPRAAKTDYCASLGGSPTASFSPAYYDGPRDGTSTSGPIPAPPHAPVTNPWGSSPHTGNQRYSENRQAMQASRRGVMHLLSRVAAAHVVDGASTTYLVGEKYLRADHYTTGSPTRDNRGMYQGEDLDNSCWAADGTNDTRPRQDASGVNSDTWFGSAHQHAFHVAFCDGSVRPVSYDIAPETHRRLGNRNDGLIPEEE